MDHVTRNNIKIYKVQKNNNTVNIKYYYKK